MENGNRCLVLYCRPRCQNYSPPGKDFPPLVPSSAYRCQSGGSGGRNSIKTAQNTNKGIQKNQEIQATMAKRNCPGKILLVFYLLYFSSRCLPSAAVLPQKTELRQHLALPHPSSSFFTLPPLPTAMTPPKKSRLEDPFFSPKEKQKKEESSFAIYIS